jgi:predicted AAA+ superfamily ATPase
MPERMDDNTGGGEIHPEEAAGEKLALSDRFGLSLGFYCLDQDEFLAIVRSYSRQRKLDVIDEELCDKALKWSRLTARRSGRSARQFIDDLEGRLGLPSD